MLSQLIQPCELRNALLFGVTDAKKHWDSKLKNALVVEKSDPKKPENHLVHMQDLMWNTAEFPFTELYRRAELRHAPAADSPHSYDNLPPEMWRLVLQRCDVTSAVNMRAVCTTTRTLAEAAVPGVEHFVEATTKEVRENATSHLVPLPTLWSFLRTHVKTTLPPTPRIPPPAPIESADEYRQYIKVAMTYR